MCSSRGLCRGGERPASRSSRSGSRNSGSHYALCALGVGLVALGIVMIVWTVMPLNKDNPERANGPGNSTVVPADEDEVSEGLKTSSVAYVLVGSGAALLLLSICLGVRNKRRADERSNAAAAAAPYRDQYLDHVVGEQGETVENAGPTYDVPSYEEAVGSGQYPIRQSNLRQSTSQLPSYEDLIAAVENEGAEPSAVATGDGSTDPVPAAGAAASEPQAEPDAAANPNAPTRSSSRASRLLKPLRVRRIKSDKLHLKDFRLHIRSPTHNPVTIEPITPPPTYEDKMPDLG